jgi:hypothetical protein
MAVPFAVSAACRGVVIVRSLTLDRFNEPDLELSGLSPTGWGWLRSGTLLQTTNTVDS